MSCRIDSRFSELMDDTSAIRNACLRALKIEPTQDLHADGEPS